MNPYEAPRADAPGPALPGAAEPTKSLAAHVALWLGIGGFMLLWGTAFIVAARTGSSKLGGGASLALGLVAFAAVALHLVGLAVAFAAPRGKRLVAALVNAVPLLLVLAKMVFASVSHG